MPRYDYVCRGCEQGHIEFIHIKEYDKRGPLKACPRCKKRKLERVVGGQDYSFQLKGAGWPSKDFKGTL
jgi:putative regulatory protein, FmdB family